MLSVIPTPLFFDPALPWTPSRSRSPNSQTRFPASPFPHTMYPGDLSVEAGIPAEVRAGLEAKGHELRVRPAGSMGSNGAIVVYHEHGVLAAGVDPRTEGVAWAK